MPAPRLPRIRPSGPRVRSPEVLARAKRMRRFKIRQRIKRGAGTAAMGVGSALLDFLEGFFDFDFGRDKSKLGLLGQALGAGVAGDSGSDNLPLPTMEEPKRVSKVKNPTFATISNQLDNLVKTANKIGVYTKEQQDALLNQIKQARRVAKEQQLEQKTPSIPEMPQSNEGSIGPLDSSIDGLIKKIDELSDTIDDKNQNSGGGLLDSILGGLGLASLFGGKGKAAKPRFKPEQLLSHAGKPLSGAALASREAKLAREAALTTKAPLLARAGTAIKAATRTGAAKIAGSAIVSSAASSRIGGLITAGVKGVGRQAGKSAISAAVRKVAGPLITKTLGRTALKSIPIIGAGIGAAFAVGRLLKGDVLGAGLDLASGLGGPLTAIPAFAASVARDTYAGVYGVQPEQDPNFNKNFPQLMSEIQGMIKEALGMSVKVQATPTAQQIGDMETPAMAPQRVSQAAAVTPPSPPTSMNPPPGATSPPPAVQTVTPAPATTPKVDAASGATSGDKGAAQMTPAPQITANALNPDAMQPPAATGDVLRDQELDMSKYEEYGYSPQQRMFVPQTGQTKRGGAQGKGAIPDPVYHDAPVELLRTLIFDYPE